MSIPSTNGIIKKFLSSLNSNKNFDGFDDLDLFRAMDPETALMAVNLIPQSTSQLRQDVFVAALSGFQQKGYFLEIGAADGIYLSNSFLLETKFGWTGILAEPAREWHEALRSNRNSNIDTRCVYSETCGKVMFMEASSDTALSTVLNLVDSDLHAINRKLGKTYEVDTVSLLDLLNFYKSPQQIDYLSIDTEGSEFLILDSFDFEKYKIRIITCEHNYSKNRNKILKLLSSNGYVRVFNSISKFDDWYVKEDVLSTLSKVFPQWRSLSHQDEINPGVPLTPEEETISVLQETVTNLIADRDSFKRGYEELQANTVSVLQETVISLIAERDAYKQGYEELLHANSIKDESI